MFEIGYDYENDWILKSSYEKYGKYCFNESFQRCQFTLKTDNTKYAQKLVIKPKFEIRTGSGFLSSSKYEYAELEQTLTIKTPY